ncbi:hypothetical protein [Roseofilum casamattae]|uniref:Uncharacterized protein n=1 Tax=Roseofilum casamattae BLCC-M143 TaxID=3022442 RepID=A0ABT7C0M6_9CYAN|nr:hypothetical protein [Roseofilum casamattae]MDJ1184865.1 hypothetical protein [Roseofilum casamattae BLCC-M143]
MMRLWISSFLILLVLAELWQWLKELTIPFPLFILAGALLAIASNFDRLRQLTQAEPTASAESPSPTVDPMDIIDVTSYEVVDAPTDRGNISQ